MPSPTSRAGRAPSRLRAPRGVCALLAVALALALGWALLDPAPAVTASVLTTSVLGVTWMLGLHRHRAAAHPAPPGPRPVRPVLPAYEDPEGRPDLPERLGRLHEDYVEQVNLAVAEDRADLVAELCDAYMEEALRMITGPDLPPAPPRR